jgi:hypothetical protein
MTDSTKYLSRTEAAAYCKGKGIPCSRARLAKLAVTGGGPAYQKFGPDRNAPALYTAANLQTWIQSQLTAPVESTSQAA